MPADLHEICLGAQQQIDPDSSLRSAENHCELHHLNLFDFSHGQSLLGHSVSPLARGEIPIGCPAPLSPPTQKA